MERARQRHADEYVSAPSAVTQYVSLNTNRPPFDDRRVRRALALSTDRETLADVVIRGYEFPAMGGFVPPALPGHSPGIALPFDPQRARDLLAEAGFPGGYLFPAVDAITWFAGEWIEYLQEQWRECLGIEVKCERMDLGACDARIDDNPPHLVFGGWAHDYPDPDCFLSPDRWWNKLGWHNEDYGKLIERARQATRQTERMNLFQQADSLLVQEAAIIPLTYGREHLLVKPWVRNYPGLRKDVIIDEH
jgi:ABC-type oligopeptide transport system substrate-binding subunit